MYNSVNVEDARFLARVMGYVEPQAAHRGTSGILGIRNHRGVNHVAVVNARYLYPATEAALRRRMAAWLRAPMRDPSVPHRTFEDGDLVVAFLGASRAEAFRVIRDVISAMGVYTSGSYAT